MRMENMIEVLIAIDNIRVQLSNDTSMFRVWNKLKEASELMREVILHERQTEVR